MKNPTRRKRELSVFDKHQLRIAKDTLRMSDVGARIMGGMTKEEARDVIRRFTGREPVENPARKTKKTTSKKSIMPLLALGGLVAFIWYMKTKEV